MANIIVITTCALVFALAFQSYAQITGSHEEAPKAPKNPITGLTDSLTNTINDLLQQRDLVGALLVLIKALLSIVLALVVGLLGLVEFLLNALALGKLVEALPIVTGLLDSLVNALGPILKIVSDLVAGLNLG